MNFEKFFSLVISLMGNYVKINTFFILSVCCGKTFPIISEWKSQKAAKLYICWARLGLSSPQGDATPANFCPEPSCSKPSCLREQAVPSSKKENSMELSKSPGSIYTLPLPLTVPPCWAYGDEAAGKTTLAINREHISWHKVICVDEFSLLTIAVWFINSTWPFTSLRYAAPVLS